MNGEFEELSTATRERSARLLERLLSVLVGRRRSVRLPGLGRGQAGLAVALGALSKMGFEAASPDLAVECLEDSFSMVEQQPTNELSLFSGLGGVGWATHFLDSTLSLGLETSVTEPIDDLLDQTLKATSWNQRFDLISGLVGLGMYAQSHPDRAFRHFCTDRVVEHLADLAEPGSVGVTWKTRLEMMIPRRREDFPHGYYDLGVAHGVAGVVAFLAAAGTSARVSALRMELLDQSVKWLLSQRREDPESGTFSHYGVDVRRGGPSRSAWCYGDPGIALALAMAADVRRDEGLLAEASRIATADRARSDSLRAVEDPWLCHGSAGLAFLYAQLHRRIGEESFREESEFWVQRTLEYFEASDHFTPTLETGAFEPARLGYLTGIAGAALSLAELVFSRRQIPLWALPLGISSESDG